MQKLYIKGEINDESVTSFVKDFNAVKDDEEIRLYINSCGGDTSHAQVISDIIELNKHRVTLIAVGTIYSAAFHIFFFATCKRIILEETTGMTHFAWTSVIINEGGQGDDYDKFMVQEMKKTKPITLKRLEKLGLTKSELNIVRKSKDCYFTTERLNQLLENAEKNQS